MAALLTELRDLGRRRREVDPDDEVVALASRAHAVLMWFEADQVGDYAVAQEWLDKAVLLPGDTDV